ncbi:N-acetyltransferase [Polymorphobacter glacialis]|uniref:N-acetyltransferase n=1 Tax=Sandarakinorhabdus glacialis TaxID=1614636 RepID=A0A916ZYB1_9SPHN|nr:GNAT family N-acetyltransferase [Polymorphobacter glacialis]GGE18972.1 N-acetyltransferase [Polymorphobacter glacialis]
MMERPPIIVRAATDTDRAATASVLAQAFIDDPAMAYLFRSAAGRDNRLARFFALMSDVDAEASNWSLALEDGVPVAAATWRAPGSWATPASAMLRFLPRLVSVFGTALPRALTLQSVLETHHPTAPHWYLQYAGCVPAQQGKGYGGAAIRDRLAQCDAEGLPAALETATESNLGLYRSLGFVITDSFPIGNTLTFWTMWREPR